MTEGILYTSLLLLLLIILLFSVFQLLVKIRKNREGIEKNEQSQVKFIVDTFHDLVINLKEKEKELGILRQKAEERAEDIESYNEYILQSVPSGVISIDSDGKITKINKVAGQILGINSDDLKGENYQQGFPEPITGIFESGAVFKRREIQLTASSGKNMRLEVTLTPLLNASKESIGRLLVFSDLTELKALESQAELRNRLSSLGEMAAGMAHELRNPLGVISGYLRLLSQKTDASAAYMIEAMSKEVGGINRIIADFLSFARPDSISLSKVDLVRLMRVCIENTAGGRGDVKVFFTAGEIPEANCDEMLMKQTFTNLLQNALDAMAKGGELRIRFASEGDAVGISISDSGHGIPQNILDKIFLPFYTTKDNGTGLGLSIAHKIIISHQGTISAESSERGAVFRIRLPLSPAGS